MLTKQKRLAQNRAAQKAFRERKDAYVKDLETKVQELEEARLAAEKENKLLQARLAALENKPTEASSKTSPPSPKSVSPDEKSESPAPKLPNSKDNTGSEFSTDFSESLAPRLEDYMIPFGSYLGYTPQLPSEDPLFSQAYQQSFDPNFGANYDLNYMSSSYDYSAPFQAMGGGLPNQFDPVMYADFVQNYDPLLATPSFPSSAPHPLINPTPPDNDEQDLDLLCTLLKDKATCFELKKFYSGCKGTPA